MSLFGDDEESYQPQAVPQAPTLSDLTNQYIQSLPQIFNAESQYAPQYAELDYNLASQYAPQYASLMQDIQNQLYPNTASLQETLAQQALQGINSPLPDYLKSQYQDALRAEIGPNAGSGIGADYVSTNLLNLGKSYQDYYRDLGLNLTNRMPLVNPQVPGFRSPTEGYNFNNAAGYVSNTYAPYVNAFTSQQNATGQINAQKSKYRMAGIGSAIGGAVGFLGGFL